VRLSLWGQPQPVNYFWQRGFRNTPTTQAMYNGAASIQSATTIVERYTLALQRRLHLKAHYAATQTGDCELALRFRAELWTWLIISACNTLDSYQNLRLKAGQIRTGQNLIQLRPLLPGPAWYHTAFTNRFPEPVAVFHPRGNFLCWRRQQSQSWQTP